MLGRSYFARKGWPFIGALAAVALFVHAQAGWLAALPIWLAVILLLVMFRDPPREIPAAPLAVVSPADGKILSVSAMPDPYLEREAMCVRIRTRFAGVYITRSPVEGKMMRMWSKLIDSGDGEQERGLCSPRGFSAWLQTDEQDDIVLVMSGSGLRRPRCSVMIGERVGQGQRCGFIPFGACVDVLLPPNVKIHKQAGDSVDAGSDILATIVHDTV